jgi:hypothetical protein
MYYLIKRNSIYRVYGMVRGDDQLKKLLVRPEERQRNMLQDLTAEEIAAMKSDEASLKHDGKDVRIRFKSKNETVPDKFKKIVPLATFTTRQQKIAKLIGAFYRVYNNSPNVKDDSHSDLLSSLAIVATEFWNNSYPHKLINTALRSIYHKTNDTRLKHITFPFETIINK